ncbi:hypothetical protein [Xylocopilactobacillus apicola]|uniref:Uncharacterized protein n=1 Tax=Xylocopilactobacillus apicola TaxID=2932184 RepID=A0AAU9D6M2_9LACO|nr:hypothetical protein [Xylocopilactobacillus apicola]BDR59499.1 hypothetical protein XA3_19400 [Xylocopilactobacillus apicola]
MNKLKHNSNIFMGLVTIWMIFSLIWRILSDLHQVPTCNFLDENFALVSIFGFGFVAYFEEKQEKKSSRIDH